MWVIFGKKFGHTFSHKLDNEAYNVTKAKKHEREREGVSLV